MLVSYHCHAWSECHHVAFSVVAKVFTDEGLEVLGWRTVPFNVSVVGRYAKETMPNIQQIFVKVAKEDNADDIERELYICRKLIERATKSASWADELYFCSLSSRTIVYKGMLRSEILGQFYLDLQNELYKSPFAIYHRRYSTNTSPRWPLAQPMRLLGHNGEINTIQVCSWIYNSSICSLYLMFSKSVLLKIKHTSSVFIVYPFLAGELELDAIKGSHTTISCMAWAWAWNTSIWWS